MQVADQLPQHLVSPGVAGGFPQGHRGDSDYRYHVPVSQLLTVDGGQVIEEEGEPGKVFRVRVGGGTDQVLQSPVIGRRHLTRLRDAVALLRAQKHIAPDAEPRLLLISGAGFEKDLLATAEASGGQVQLIDLELLYNGA